MAILRETVGTLKAYLLIVGILGGLSNVGSVFGPDLALWYRFSALPGIVLCGLYLYLGVTLEAMLRQNPTFVLTVFRIAMVIQAAYVVLEIALSIAYGVTPVPLAIVGFLIAWYLHVQARRLIQEAAVAEQPFRGE